MHVNDVEIEDDVATLTGTVGSWVQHEAAKQAVERDRHHARRQSHHDCAAFVLQDMPEEND